MDVGNNISDSGHENHVNIVNQSGNGDSDTNNLGNHDIEINNRANQARTTIIPKQSQLLYFTQYNKFLKWCQVKRIHDLDETTMLAYFQFLSESYQASTLWSTFSKLKSTLLLKQKKDISKYLELQCFLKRLNKTHESKKSKVFTKEETLEFLIDAPDEIYLLHKVVLIFGLHGCLRKIELLNMNMNNIKQHGSVFEVFIPNTKTGKSKSFFTSEEFYPIIKKYIRLRPNDMQRFFVQYRNQHCTRQNVGKGKLGDIPKEIAKFLHLDEPEKYTGHAFRRTSATLVVDEGANMETLKRHGVWKSNTVAEGYINESNTNKKAISKFVSSAINFNQRESMSNRKRVETITSGSLYNEQSTNMDLQATKSFHHGATNSVLSHSNEKISRNFLPHTDITYISPQIPNLTQYQYRPKVSTRKVPFSGHMNMNLRVNDFIKPFPESEKTMELTQIKCDKYETITQEDLPTRQHQKSHSNHNNQEGLKEIINQSISSSRSNVNILEKNDHIVGTTDDITQEELEEVVSTQFENQLLQNSKSKMEIEEKNKKSGIFKKDDQILGSIENVTQEELEEIVSTQFENQLLQNFEPKEKIGKEKKIGKENKKPDGDFSIIQDDLEETFTGSKTKEMTPIFILKNCNIYINRT